MSCTRAELEALNLLVEECAEVTQAAVKVARFGWYSCAPDTPGVDNTHKLLTELGDLCAAMAIVSSNCSIDHKEIIEQMRGKMARMRQNPQHYYDIEIP